MLEVVVGVYWVVGVVVRGGCVVGVVVGVVEVSG